MNDAELAPSVLRRQAYEFIRATATDESISVSERLEKCRNKATVYFCLTGDESLMDADLKSSRQSMVDSIPSLMAGAKRKQQDNAAGQISVI